MKRIFGIIAALGIAAAGLAGCNSTDSHITCNEFDDILYECSWSCGATWDCEEVYDFDLYADEKDLMDCCADCMHDEIFVYDAYCSDANIDCSVTCDADIDCLTDMEDFLGACGW